MKKKFEIVAVTLITIFLAGIPSYLGAQINKTWGGAATGYMLWTVDDVSNNHMHMAIGDSFTIERLVATKPPKFRPSNALRSKWRLPSSQVDFELIEVPSGKPTKLCGFVNINTDEHSENKFGHGQAHGFLVILTPQDKLNIIWSALPLDENQLPSTPRCTKLEQKHHGGIAHASN